MPAHPAVHVQEGFPDDGTDASRQALKIALRNLYVVCERKVFTPSLVVGKLRLRFDKEVMHLAYRPLRADFKRSAVPDVVVFAGNGCAVTHRCRKLLAISVDT